MAEGGDARDREEGQGCRGEVVSDKRREEEASGGAANDDFAGRWSLGVLVERLRKGVRGARVGKESAPGGLGKAAPQPIPTR